MSDERRVWSETDDAYTALNSVEPVVCYDLCDSVYSDNFAESVIFKTNLLQNNISVCHISAESKIIKRTHDQFSVISLAKIEFT